MIPAPKENCPDAEDCTSDPQEMGHVGTFGPICGTCIVDRRLERGRGVLRGTCRSRTDRGESPCTAPICESYVPRAGAFAASGRPTQTGDSTVVQLARAQKAQDARGRRETRGAGGQRSADARREQPATPPRPKIPDGPVGEVEMTREELKSLIREAMDEERGGLAPLSPKWEGGMALLKPADPALQPQALPVEAPVPHAALIPDKPPLLSRH